ncbi:hypothetical protein, partial [Streptomyces sp. NPDC003483]
MSGGLRGGRPLRPARPDGLLAATRQGLLVGTRLMGGQIWRDYMETQTNYDSLWAQPTTHKV